MTTDPYRLERFVKAVSFGQSIPFLPLIDQLRENFRIEELDGEPEIIAKVEHGMRRMGELEAHLPAIRSLLSVAPGDPAFAALEGAAAAPLCRAPGGVTPWRTATPPRADHRRPALDRHQQ